MLNGGRREQALILCVLVFWLTAGHPLRGLAAPGPDGFVGVPWGANRSQVDRAMTQQGFRLKSQEKKDAGGVRDVYDGTFAGIAGDLFFDFLNGAFYSGSFQMHCRDGGAAASTASRKLSSMISSKFGAPTFSQEPSGAYEWDGLQAPGSSDVITIIVLYAVTTERCGGMVSVHYMNQSLQNRLAKKR